MLATVRSIHANLVRLQAKGAEPAQIADAAVATWRRIEVALAPIIGQRGVMALFRRSAFLLRAEHPWLMTPNDNGSQVDEFAILHTAFASRTSAEATEANGALLHTFHDLLSKLIGGSLTERLLQSVPDNLSSGDAVQDNSP